jgi:putative FmdB family regulatory protein
VPVYEYQCHDCGLRFEKTIPASKRKVEIDCLSCGNPATQRPPSSISSSFETSPSSLGLQNTGVADFDYNADRIIGADSAQKWEVVNRRAAHKQRILEDNPGTDKWELSKMPDGDYRIMRPEETRATIAARLLNGQAIPIVRKKRATSN